MDDLIVLECGAGGPPNTQDARRAQIDVLANDGRGPGGHAKKQMPNREIGCLGVVLEIGLPGLLPGCAGSVTGQGVAAGDQPASERAPGVGQIQVGRHTGITVGCHEHADPLPYQTLEIVHT